jgi:hypothetical protein
MKILTPFTDKINEIRHEVLEVSHENSIPQARVSIVEHATHLIDTVFTAEKEAAMARYGRHMTNNYDFPNKYKTVLKHVQHTPVAEKRGSSLLTMDRPAESSTSKDIINLKEEPVIDQYLYDKVLADTAIDPVEAELQNMIAEEQIRDLATGNNPVPQTIAAANQSAAEEALQKAQAAAKSGEDILDDIATKVAQ